MTQTQESRFVGFDCLKRSVSIEEVLARYGLLDKLRRSGESLTGVCPLHRGHNPAQFRVSLGLNCWICFGDCHSGGSIIDFVARMEGVGIRDAALLLQDWFGVSSNKGLGADVSRPVLLHECKRKPASPLRLSNPPLGFALGALDQTHPYLEQRGLTLDTIATFGIGACAHGMLRGWIAIPIHDLEGRLIAYAGRWPGVPPEGMAKYRLPRGFRKSLELFNQHRVQAAHPSEPLVVVEGFFGCMRVWQAGYHPVVSTMGSMVSSAQAQRIVELAGENGQVLLLFDEDEAGRKGRAEARARLRELATVRVLRMGNGQQPDSVEPEALLQLIRGQVETEVAA